MLPDGLLPQPALFLRNRLLRRRHRPQGDVNRIGCELRRCACALRLRTHRYRLQLVAAQRERHGKLAAGLDRQLAGRAAALTQGRLRFCPWRFGLDRQHLRLRNPLARRASVTTNGSRKLERALLSSSDWRDNMRGRDGWVKLMLGGLRLPPTLHSALIVSPQPLASILLSIVPLGRVWLLVYMPCCSRHALPTPVWRYINLPLQRWSLMPSGPRRQRARSRLRRSSSRLPIQNRSRPVARRPNPN
jgi:hypothetical protein